MQRKAHPASDRPIDDRRQREIEPVGCGRRHADSTCFVLSLAFVLLFTGCATYQSRPLTVADIDAAFVARTLDDAALRAFINEHTGSRSEVWPPAAWDLRLLTLAAFFRHSDMGIARAKLASAEAAVVTAGARPNPSIGFSPTFDLNPVNGVSPWTLGFTLEVPVETAGKRGYRVEQARERLNDVRLNFAAVAWRVRSRVRQGLVEVEQADSEVSVLEKREQANAGVLALMEARLKAGEASLTEMQLWRIAAAQTRVELDDAHQHIIRAQIQLADALGMPVDALEHVTFSYSTVDQLPLPASADPLRRQALLHRPDVLGALSDYDASQVALQLEVARQYPDVHLGPGYTWDQGENKFSLGLTLGLPLFNQNRGPIAEAEGRRSEAAANLNAVQARVIGEVELAFANYRGALVKLATAEELLTERKTQVKAMNQSLAAGATDRLEFMQTQVEDTLAERVRIAAYGEAQTALGKLEDALQRPLESGDDSAVPASLLNPSLNNL
ncbi:MAG: TolC family protein [Lacunisphaera sp.]